MRCIACARVVLAALLGLLTACARPDARPNVVVVVIDTLRRDAVGTYGNATASTPRLDRLAAEGLVFDDVRATAPWTIPAVSSILTSRLPSEHGEGAQRAPGAPETVRTLAEMLRDTGWRTAAFVEADWPLLHRGFERFDIPAGDLMTRMTSPAQDGAAVTFSRAIEWLRAGPAEPFLLLVHTYEAHDYFVGKDYQRAFARARHPEYRGRFLDWAIRDNDEDLGARLVDALLAATPDDIAFVRALYAGGIAAVDTQVGRLDDALAERGVADRTLVVIASDHGEGFDPEQRRVHHAGRLHDDLLAVPLFLRWPGRVPVGHEARRVTTLDVLPTILRLARVDPPVALRGRPLLAPTHGLSRLTGAAFRPDVQVRPAVAEESTFSIDDAGRRQLSTVRQVAIVAHGLKLITADARRELYEPRVDPDERTNLLSSRAADAAVLEGMLEGILPHLRGDGEPVRPETTEQLRALGYVQ